jgi:ParB-like nuclease domain
MPKLVKIHPDRLRPNTFNPNSLSPANEAKLAKSLVDLGQFKPVIARFLPDKETGTDYEILGGEHRWTELRGMGVEEIYVFDLGKIDNKTAKKISLADNARYGVDDVGELATILSDIGVEDAQLFLPYTDTDVSAIFASSSISLDELDLPDSYDVETTPEPKSSKAPKTHTVMRFKVPLTDAERITELVAKTAKRQGFTTGDELTNAGDTLVHLLLSGEK